MDPEVCNPVPAQGLEIEKVCNGWIVYVGNLRVETMNGCTRIRYVFQDAEELGRAVVNLLQTGRHEAPINPANRTDYVTGPGEDR